MLGTRNTGTIDKSGAFSPVGYSVTEGGGSAFIEDISLPPRWEVITRGLHRMLLAQPGGVRTDF